MNKEAGFTLIEIIASMIIVGILAVVAGMGIVSATKSYIFTKENSKMAQKSRIALARMNREFIELSDVSAASSNSITLENTYGNRTVGFDNNCIKIASNGTILSSGDILIDNVTSFSLSYFKGSNPWVTGTDDVNLLSSIQIRMTLSRPDSGDVTFSTTVSPRNNKNFGGQPPPTPSAPPAAAPPTCFISTASN